MNLKRFGKHLTRNGLITWIRDISVGGWNTIIKSVANYGEFELKHYQYLKSLGFTHISSGYADWGIAEPNINEPGGYNSWCLNQIRKHIDLAYQAGLYSIIRPRVQFDDSGASDSWSGWARNDMVNYRSDYPHMLSEVTEDLLPRYLDYLTFLITNLNDLPGFDAFDPYAFPYHLSSKIWTEEELSPRIDQIKNVTIPTIISHCSNLTNRLLLIDPVHEGTKRIQGYPTYWSLPCGRYGPFRTVDGYGWDETDAPLPSKLNATNIAYVFSSYANHQVDYYGYEWDYNPNYWRDGFEVGQRFQNTWDVPFIHIEGNSIVIHGSTPYNFNERPIRRDRLDMLEQHMADTCKWPSHWMVYEYSQRIDLPSIENQSSHSIIDDAINQPPPVNPEILDIINRYIHVTPKFPWSNIIKFIGPIGAGLYLIFRTPRRG